MFYLAQSVGSQCGGREAESVRGAFQRGYEWSHQPTRRPGPVLPKAPNGQAPDFPTLASPFLRTKVPWYNGVKIESRKRGYRTLQ